MSKYNSINMINEFPVIYFLLIHLFFVFTNTTHNYSTASPVTVKATDSVSTNVTQYDIDLMHKMLVGILSQADAARNFLIAPQEALILYRQMYGTEKEIVDDEAKEADSFGEQIEIYDLNNKKSNNAKSNEIKVKGPSNSIEFADFNHIRAKSPIWVSNILYANIHIAERFTRKLKNLQFVFCDEDDKNTISNNNTNNKNNTNDSKQSESDYKYIVCAMESNTTTIHNTNNTNNNQQKYKDTNIHNLKENKNNKKRNELINAVRINSRWAHNFQKRDTHKRQFHMPQIHMHAYLNAMRKDDIFPYANLKELNASALELSLQRWQLKMLIILPNARNGLRQLLQHLSANVTLLDELCGMTLLDTGQQPEVTDTRIGRQRQHLESTLVRVFLPLFHFRQRTILDDIFQQLHNVTANVDLLGPRSWQMTQEVHFAMNEDGIGELEPSMVLFWNAFSSLRTKPLMFCVDHPFLFIVHNRQGIQLLGHVAQLHE